MMKKYLTLLSLGCALMLLCSCAGKPQPSDDNPANHGPLAIMETENGYYYNYGYTGYTVVEDNSITYTGKQHLLRYYDKESGESILLCNKPECEHQGDDSCVATYKNLNIINSALYDEHIYVYGLEKDGNLIRFNLYRATLDGSSMDLVGTVFEAENTIDKEIIFAPLNNANSVSKMENAFIIHRGYAYLPYYLRIGTASMGFKGGGLMQMDLQTGKTKLLYELEYLTSPYPFHLRAYGDYVYMDLVGGTSSKGTMRYVISQNVIEYTPATAEDEFHSIYDAITEEAIYMRSIGCNPDTGTFFSYEAIDVFDGTTGDRLPKKQIVTGIPKEEMNGFKSYLTYEDMLVIATAKRIAFYSLKEEDYGEKLGEMVPMEEPDNASNSTSTPEYKITDGSLFMIQKAPNLAINGDYYDGKGTYQLYQVYKCPLADIFAGTGTWEEAFTIGPTTEEATYGRQSQY